MATGHRGCCGLCSSVGFAIGIQTTRREVVILVFVFGVAPLMLALLMFALCQFLKEEESGDD